MDPGFSLTPIILLSRMRSRLPAVSPSLYARITAAALCSLVVIVLSGAAVRLSGSGLGCPTWPECHGAIIQTQLSSHAAIEYGNRLFTGIVAICAVAACLLAFLRKPFRRDLAIIAALLPFGVAGQATLGGMAVLYGLAPGWVMSHFLLSMLILAAAVTLAWRSRHEPDAPALNDRLSVLAVRALVPVAAWVLFMGTAATASGPHPGSSGTGEVVPRLNFHGADTMTWVIHWHGRFSTFFGLCAVAVWFWLRRQGASYGVRRSMTAVCVLLACQGVVGGVQYELGLPTEIVWVHIILATATWLSVLWSVAEAGRLEPRRVEAPAEAEKDRLRAPAGVSA